MLDENTQLRNRVSSKVPETESMVKSWNKS